MVNLESNIKVFSTNEKIDIILKIAGKYILIILYNIFKIEAFLQDEETIEAEIFVNKAGNFINEINDYTLLLRFKSTFAQILDFNRKFIDAAYRYYELSKSSKVNENDLLLL